MRGWRGWRTIGGVGIAYAGLTVVMTWPMAIRLSLPYATIQGDFGYWLWNFWWIKKALVDLGTSPYFTSYLFHPTGTTLVFHNLSPYHGLIAIPLQLLGADVLTTYNLLYLSAFVIGAVGMFLLVRDLTGAAFASFLAGAVYVFSPSHTVSYQWADMWATQWLPFTLLFAIRVLRAGRSRDAIGLAFMLTLATLTDWYQPVFLLLAIFALALSSVFSRRHPDLAPSGVFRGLLWSLLLYGLFVSPLGYVVLKELAAGDAILKTPSLQPFELLGFRVVEGDVISYGVLLGWIPIALVVYGIARGLDFWMKRFVVLLIVFFILSLGEGLRLPGVTEPVLPLPFLLWRKIPLLGTIRNPVHFWIVAHVCLAVLAGHGAKKLWERLEGWRPERRSAFFRPILGGGLLACMLIEVLQAPLRPAPLRIHPVYQAIRRDDARGAILDAPTGTAVNNHHAGRSMYVQTFHDHPLVGGYTNFETKSRLAFLEQNRALGFFLERSTHTDNMPDGVEELRTFLTKYQIGWVIVQKRIRDPVCDQQRIRGWSIRKFLNLITPALGNNELSVFWGKESAKYCGNWNTLKMREADALVRRTLGPPLWDDAELVAYKAK